MTACDAVAVALALSLGIGTGPIPWAVAVAVAVVLAVTVTVPVAVAACVFAAFRLVAFVAGFRRGDRRRIRGGGFARRRARRRRHRNRGHRLSFRWNGRVVARRCLMTIARRVRRGYDELRRSGSLWSRCRRTAGRRGAAGAGLTRGLLGRPLPSANTRPFRRLSGNLCIVHRADLFVWAARDRAARKQRPTLVGQNRHQTKAHRHDNPKQGKRRAARPLQQTVAQKTGPGEASEGQLSTHRRHRYGHRRERSVAVGQGMESPNIASTIR